jgi:hypothetical protein
MFGQLQQTEELYGKHAVSICSRYSYVSSVISAQGHAMALACDVELFLH